MKIKTRKAIEEAIWQANRLKQPSHEETTPENSAVGKMERGAKYVTYDTARFVGSKTKQALHSVPKKSKAKRQAKHTVQTLQKAVQVSKAIGKAVIATAKATAKAIVATGKALYSALVAGGWIAVIVILVVCLIVAMGAMFFSDENGGTLPAVALSQVGNIGGEPYWSWYGFSSRVEWCACFVSWCGEQCGYIEAEIMPKYASCADGVTWFQEQELWLDSVNEPAPGMIIFFDWEQDGNADHTGIVTSVKDGIISTVEGNADDSVAVREYPVGDEEILGYGILLHTTKKDATQQG